MKDRPYILVVDDDPNISRLEQLYLEKENYEVQVAADGNQAIEMFSKLPPDLVLLDVMLPGADGYEVLKTIRKSGSIPVIMVTAKGETFDKVLCLELGADDYIVKPFDGKELTARVKAVLRRARGNDEEQAGNLSFPGLTVSLKEYDVHYEGKRLEMPPKELEVLYFLASHPNQVFTREQLLRCAHQTAPGKTDRQREVRLDPVHGERDRVQVFYRPVENLYQCRMQNSECRMKWL